MDSTTAAAKVDKIVRDRLDASMIKLRRRGPHFATEVSELLQLREASYEGIELHEDGIQTVSFQILRDCTHDTDPKSPLDSLSNGQSNGDNLSHSGASEYSYRQEPRS